MSNKNICLKVASHPAAHSHLDEIFKKYSDELAHEEYYQEIMKIKTSRVVLNYKKKLNVKRTKANVDPIPQEKNKNEESKEFNEKETKMPDSSELDDMERLLDSLINKNEETKNNDKSKKDKYNYVFDFIEKYQ